MVITTYNEFITTFIIPRGVSPVKYLRVTKTQLEKLKEK